MLNEFELRIMRRIGLEAGKGLSSIWLKEGTYLSEIQDRIREIFIGYDYGTLEVDFPGICCISPTSTICHGIPDKRRVRENELLKVDLVIKKEGLYVDTCWTFLVGMEHRNLWMRSYLCFCSIINYLIQHENNPALSWYSLALYGQEKSRQLNLGIVNEFVGHGIGRQMHTNLNVGFVPEEAEKGKIPYDVPFTIEPIFHDARHVYRIGEVNDHEYIDCNEGAFVMFEHTIVRTPNGFQVLTLNNWDREFGLIKWND